MPVRAGLLWRLVSNENSWRSQISDFVNIFFICEYSQNIHRNTTQKHNSRYLSEEENYPKKFSHYFKP